MNFFKLYIGDYQRDTAHLSITEHGAYLLMLQHYYATERPLPTGKALHRMLRAQDKAERDAIDAIVERFWHETPDGLVNERADGEITKARTQADTNRQIAVAREAKRKDARTPHEGSTNRATNDEPNHSHSHKEIKTQERSPSGSRLPPGWVLPEDWEAWATKERPDLDVSIVACTFADFWHSKPGKDGRKLDWQATWRNWVRAEKSRPKSVNGIAHLEGLL